MPEPARRFHVASDRDIRNGKTTDIYFVRARQVLEAKGLAKVRALAEVSISGGLPKDWTWGVFCGVEEAAHLFEGLPVNVESLPEGTIFRNRDYHGVRVPYMNVEGPYGDYAVYETPLLGLLCQASGIATMAARVRKAAGTRHLLAFGVRRMHPALTPMIDRASYIGGMDAVSSLIGGQTIGMQPVGTMPHTLMIMFGDQKTAWKAFDEVIPPDVRRIILVDTYFDEKTEAIMAAETLGRRLYGVRLDTPSSRRGNFAELIREVRWELDVRGFKDAKIYVSGGLDDQAVKRLAEAPVDGFGVGTSVSNANTIDFAFDIVEKDGKPVAKRGKLGGRKQLYRCKRCFEDLVMAATARPTKCPKCQGAMRAMMVPLIREGKPVAKLPAAKEIRHYVLDQLKHFAT